MKLMFHCLYSYMSLQFETFFYPFSESTFSSDLQKLKSPCKIWHNDGEKGHKTWAYKSKRYVG